MKLMIQPARSFFLTAAAPTAVAPLGNAGPRRTVRPGTSVWDLSMQDKWKAFRQKHRQGTYYAAFQEFVDSLTPPEMTKLQTELPNWNFEDAQMQKFRLIAGLVEETDPATMDPAAFTDAPSPDAPDAPAPDAPDVPAPLGLQNLIEEEDTTQLGNESQRYQELLQQKQEIEKELFALQTQLGISPTPDKPQEAGWAGNLGRNIGRGVGNVRNTPRNIGRGFRDFGRGFEEGFSTAESNTHILTAAMGSAKYLLN